MSEAIAEMVLPGTYIEVRSEGLIGASAVSTGNLGIVGTAARGPRNQVVTLSSYAEAIDAFGAPDSFASPIETGSPLSLVRTLQLAFSGGARNVWAVRIALADPVAAFTDASKPRITAASPGTWGNRISVELTTGKAADDTPTWTLTATRGAQLETITGTGGKTGAIWDKLSVPGASRLVTVAGPKPDPANDADIVGVPAGTGLGGGSNKANVGSGDVAAGLAALEDQTINVVLVAGFGAAADGIKGAVTGHLEATENAGRERIAVLGASLPGTATDAAPVLTNVTVSDDRVVLVAPGIVVPDAASGAPVVLPPSHLAAVVAGSLCSIAPHVSLTNKALPVDRLDVAYSTATVKQLLDNRFTILRPKLGYQVVKGITTDAGAFKQISVRRTVDYAKAGVRSGADPYIGKLNNSRVRAALKATLDGFLSQMVLDEMLVSYELAVSATRAQEIQGIAAVYVTLRPTFSIDFIRVTMTLQ